MSDGVHGVPMEFDGAPTRQIAAKSVASSNPRHHDDGNSPNLLACRRHDRARDDHALDGTDGRESRLRTAIAVALGGEFLVGAANGIPFCTWIMRTQVLQLENASISWLAVQAA